MKRKLFDVLGMIILSIAMLCWGCDPTEIENDPDLNDPSKEAPTVFLKKATDITLISAKISAGLKSGGLRTEAWFEYKAKGDDTYASTKVISFTEDSITMTYNLPGLKKDTQYFFKVVAKNKKGTSEKELVFNTIVEIVTDYDGNKYNAVRIGDQVWLQSNLRTTRFANGDKIRILNYTGRCDDNWNRTEMPTMIFKPGDAKYGGYYNGYFWNETREFIPGYKIPSLDDFKKLVNFIGYNDTTLTRMVIANIGEKRLMHENIYDQNIVNSSGFSGIGAGYFYSNYYSSRLSDCKFMGYNGDDYVGDYFLASNPIEVFDDITTYCRVFILDPWEYINRKYSKQITDINNGVSIRLIKK